MARPADAPRPLLAVAAPADAKASAASSTSQSSPASFAASAPRTLLDSTRAGPGGAPSPPLFRSGRRWPCGASRSLGPCLRGSGYFPRAAVVDRSPAPTPGGHAETAALNEYKTGILYHLGQPPHDCRSGPPNEVQNSRFVSFQPLVGRSARPPGVGAGELGSVSLGACAVVGPPGPPLGTPSRGVRPLRRSLPGAVGGVCVACSGSLCAVGSLRPGAAVQAHPPPSVAFALCPAVAASAPAAGQHLSRPPPVRVRFS